MVFVAMILLALTMMGGAYLLSYILTNKNTPKKIALIHGTAGLVSIICLLIASFFFEGLFSILIIFILVALGGGVLFYLDHNGKRIPKLLAVGHGIMAIIGFVFLVLVVFHLF